MPGTIEQQKNGWRYRVEVGIDPGTGSRNGDQRPFQVPAGLPRRR